MGQLGQHYSYNTVDNRCSTLRRIFESAVRDGIIRFNPVSDDRIKNTSRNKPETRSLSLEEAASLLNNLSMLPTLRQQTILATYLHTGLRREELLGLRWEDIDLNRNEMHIQRSVTYRRGAHVSPLKTRQSNRYILLSEQLRRILIQHERREGFLISVDGTDPLPLRMYEKEMDTIRSTFNMPDVHSREFRRTFSTLQIAANVPLPVVQANMGHTKPNMTLQAYVKVERHSRESSRNAISDLIASHNSTNHDKTDS